jgi:hypothetical protein
MFVELSSRFRLLQHRVPHRSLNEALVRLYQTRDLFRGREYERVDTRFGDDPKKGSLRPKPVRKPDTSGVSRRSLKGSRGVGVPY